MDFNEFIAEWHSGSPSIVVKTSGSTGVPKQIRLNKGFVRASALRTNSFFNINGGSRLHSCVAADYIGGKMMAVRADLAGCRLTWETPSNRPLANFDSNERIDLLAIVPSQMLHILDHPDQMPQFGAIIIGGSSIPPALRQRIHESGLNVYETYGMTETSSHIALRKISAEAGWMETLPGITVSSDERGCLVIHFDTGEEIVTNDLAVIDSERRFAIKGRYDKMIITGGKKVNPFDVEGKISHLFNTAFVITSEADDKWGQKVVLHIEGTPSQNADTLPLRLRELLEPHEMPKDIVWLEKLPRTANGKLLR